MGTTASVTLAFLAKDAASGTIRGLSKSIDSLGSAGGRVGQTLASGFKLAAATIATVAGAAVGLGVAFAKAAVEDEKNQRLLIDALKARGLATAANIATTDKLIASGAKLAFTDDQIRAGLSTATQFTKNFADAQKILTAAQNIARAKNISLEAATSLVGKAYMGNGKAAKQLGIDLSRTITVTNQKIKTDKKGLKTVTETNKQVKTQIKGLAAVNLLNKQFAGAAAGYADTTQGRFESLQITLAELGESIGYTLLPIVNDLLGLFRDKAVPVIETVVGKVREFITNNQALISSVIQTVGSVADRLLPVLGSVAEFIFTKVIPAVGGFVDGLVKPGGVIDSVGKVVGPILDQLAPAFGKLWEGMGKLIDQIAIVVGDLWGDGNGPLAVAVKGIGGLFIWATDQVAKFAEGTARQIANVRRSIQALMDSPLWKVIEAVLNAMNPYYGLQKAGLIPTAPTFAAPSYTPSAKPLSENVPVSANLYIDSKLVASTVNKSLGATALVAGTSRTMAR